MKELHQQCSAGSHPAGGTLEEKVRMRAAASRCGNELLRGHNAGTFMRFHFARPSVLGDWGGMRQHAEGTSRLPKVAWTTPPGLPGSETRDGFVLTLS